MVVAEIISSLLVLSDYLGITHMLDGLPEIQGSE